jgi:hypothetical protein
VNRTLEDTAVHRDVPAVWEVLRAASGLVAVVTLALVMVGITVFAEDERQPRILFAAAAQAPPLQAANQPSVVLVASPPTQAVFVFYLVSTPQQAEFADWGEQVNAHERITAGAEWTDRYYEIHYLRDEDEERVVGQAILDRLLSHGDLSLVELIDLRQVDAGAAGYHP